MRTGSATRPSLTVVVGAGASVAVGIPGTCKLTDTVTGNLRSHETRDCADFRPRVESLLEAVRAYYGETFNFEQLWDALEAANALAVGWRRGNAPTTAEAALTAPRPTVKNALDYWLLSEALFVAKVSVQSAVIEASMSALRSANWPAFSHFWRSLAERFSLTVVTLNYDTLIEQALEWDGAQQGMQPVTGERIWRLDPTRLHEPGNGHRLLHLHGSVQFGSREYGAEPNRFAYEDSSHELYWHPTIESAQQTMWGHSSPRSQVGREMEGDRIVVGLNKPDKLLVEPLHSYQVELVNQVRRAPRLLVVGYGFGDLHVNAALEGMTRVHGSARRICVVDCLDLPTAAHSPQRMGLLVMLQRWAEMVFQYRVSYDEPWASSNGCVRLYTKGFLDAPINEIADFFYG